MRGTEYEVSHTGRYSIIIFTCFLIQRLNHLYRQTFTSSVLMMSFEMKSLIFRGVAGFDSLPCRNFIHGGSSLGTFPCFIKKYSTLNDILYVLKIIFIED